MGGYIYEIVPEWSDACGNPYGCTTAQAALELLQALSCDSDGDAFIHTRDPQTGRTVEITLDDLRDRAKSE